MAIKSDVITLPSYWACALINGDYSGLNDAEEKRCVRAESKLSKSGAYIAGKVEDSERFTWNYRLYDPDADCDGGDVMDYVVLRGK
jgi:hypothetical protein